MALREMTAAELAAGRIRKIILELTLEVEALEASIPAVPRNRGQHLFKNPVTGKVTKIKKVTL